MGQPIGVNDAREHIFGLVLLNDWSARDFQRWEMLPLGPFNSKNFVSALSLSLLNLLKPFKSETPVYPLSYPLSCPYCS